MSASSESHWDQVYDGRLATSFAWYEPEPATLPVVLDVTDPSTSLIDVGGGTGRLVEHLLRRGYQDLSVLDVSGQALRALRGSLGEHGDRVAWIHRDVLDLVPDRSWQCWHDRAAFHFLTAPDQRRRYVAVAAQAVPAGGTVIVATFAESGPERCAGLPVRRYSVDTLGAEFEHEFTPVDGGALPIGPEGDQRPYVFVVLRR